MFDTSFVYRITFFLGAGGVRLCENIQNRADKR